MIFIILLLSVFLADLLLKKYVEAKVGDKEEHSLAGGKILVRKLHNDGLALGLMADHPKLIQRGTLGILGVMAAYFVWLLFLPGRKAEKTGISMVIGGGLCNWFDRFHQGYVTDYFSFNTRWKKLKSVVFNLSDLCIFIGGILYLIGNALRKAGKMGDNR